jgi:hypothetical protein
MDRGGQGGDVGGRRPRGKGVGWHKGSARGWGWCRREWRRDTSTVALEGVGIVWDGGQGEDGQVGG